MLPPRCASIEDPRPSRLQKHQTIFCTISFRARTESVSCSRLSEWLTTAAAVEEQPRTRTVGWTRSFTDRNQELTRINIKTTLLPPSSPKGKKDDCSGRWTTVTQACEYESDSLEARRVVSRAPPPTTPSLSNAHHKVGRGVGMMQAPDCGNNALLC